ncbi:MAG TPA: GFA family protein, partial [Caulobacteraceae bacterium]|nr:GFA family protein [Caulobacteraceae bacterium]
KIYVKTGGSGRKRLQSFCGTCGASLFSQGEGEATIGIRWGSIRQRMALTLKKQIWRRSAAPWVCAFQDVPAMAEE